jgi:hypothetical protein
MYIYTYIHISRLKVNYKVTIKREITYYNKSSSLSCVCHNKIKLCL